MATQPTTATATTAPEFPRNTYVVLYDGQCEVCQASVAWLKILDTRGQSSCLPIGAETIAQLGPRLDLEQCMRQLHVLSPEGEFYVGWDAVACLARLSPWTRMIGVLGRAFPFRNFGALLYGFVASHRYALSKCRGGACKASSPAAVKRTATLSTFWSCYTLGFLLKLPLVIWAAFAGAFRRLSVFRRTYGRRLELLNGKLNILFLNGLLPNSVPIIFGELFTAIVYDGVAVDPGSPKMRRSLVRHLRELPAAIEKVVATHAHEEHVGNLNWLSRRASVPLYVSAMTAQFLMPFKKLPFVRSLIIGQPPSLEQPFDFFGATLPTRSGLLRVIDAPGHSDDHIVLYDADEKLLIAGDAFMGSYFSTPNPDVDSHKWLVTLERLLELDIEILIEGHGHIHTLRRDIPDFPGVVVREDPKVGLARKLDYLRWLRERIEEGMKEELPVRAIEASLFPWGNRLSWETCANDECIRLLSLGHFSRTELVRSFVRNGREALPEVYECKMYRD